MTLDTEVPVAWDSGSDTGNSLSSNSDKASGASKETNKAEEIAQAEDRAVFRIRLFASTLLVSFTVGVALLVFYFTRKGEKDAFEDQFLDDSEKVFQALGSTLDSSLGAVDAYAVSLVSYARFSNSTWPLVALPDFAARVSKIRSLSKSFLVGQFQVVQEEDRLAWEAFSEENAGWVDEAMKVQKADPTYQGANLEDYTISPVIYNNLGVTPYGSGPYYPTWQQYPSVPIFGPPFNWDGSFVPGLLAAFNLIDKNREVVIGLAPNLPNPNDPNSEGTVAGNNAWVRQFVGDSFDHTEPYVEIYYPVFEGDGSSPLSEEGASEGEDSKMVSVLTISFYWRNLIESILPPGTVGVVVVIENACGQSFTYQVNGPEVLYQGPSDLHDTEFDHMEQISMLTDLKEFHFAGTDSYTGLPLSEASCPYNIRMYPSTQYEDRFLTSKPAIYTATAISIFLLTCTVFFMYDILVERRQEKVMKSAVQSNAIVSSLFPSTVRKRLYDMENAAAASEPQKQKLKSWLHDGKDANIMTESTRHHDLSGSLTGRPIADLFPEATVMFADIAGFTAWASIREPSQVFSLLENLYGSFDSIAAQRKVFKVETIGDSYVAVAGLPDPRKDHASVMARFANDCRMRMTEVTRELGVTLGPDTEDLSMRFGLHSGPVTAGVLRGQKSRFQLFGDTVNTAARMESTGHVRRIQISQSTADHLVKAKKGHWIVPRKDTVEVKGKGLMQTYWVEIGGGPTSATTAGETPDIAHLPSSKAHTKLERLVEWNVDVLARLLRHIVHRRQAVARKGLKKVVPAAASSEFFSGSNVLGEVKEIIELPDYDGYSDSIEDADSIVLDPIILVQLRDYVVAIATSYDRNAFHNFEHASHVCMSVAKLMSRIVAADDVYDKAFDKGKGAIGSTKHDHTYGITSDPLTQFACVFSALIHDAEHPGVPNAQLVKEETPLAKKYEGRSVAEQNSVDVAWTIFTAKKFSELRSIVCPTDVEMKRFRQLVVNSVMATDIMDKELKALRNDRWDRAFANNVHVEEAKKDSRNRKATIVIEHLLQASDVAHTMQHWHIYRKWNERLFEEMHVAFQQGRADKDPAEYWYQGEMGFFDFYIIPLAKKLSECGVFGVSGDEYLNYATKNRAEWERRGKEVVADIVERLGSKKSPQ